MGGQMNRRKQSNGRIFRIPLLSPSYISNSQYMRKPTNLCSSLCMFSLFHFTKNEILDGTELIYLIESVSSLLKCVHLDLEFCFNKKAWQNGSLGNLGMSREPLGRLIFDGFNTYLCVLLFPIAGIFKTTLRRKNSWFTRVFFLLVLFSKGNCVSGAERFLVA